MRFTLSSKYTLRDDDGEPIPLDEYPKDIEDFVQKKHHALIQECQDYINNRTKKGDANTAYDSAMGII